MNKENIKNTLINLKTPDNEKKVDYLLKLLEEISMEQINAKFEQLNISEDNMEAYLSDLIKKTDVPVSNAEKFIGVNEWFCYGRTGSTIHLHIIPEDLRGTRNELGDEAFYSRFKDLLEDFLSRMQVMFSEDETINSLFAVSPIFYNQNISWAFESLGFDKLIEIDKNNENDNMSEEQKDRFINMFNKGGKFKKVYYTKMTREKLLEREYKQIDDQKNHNI